MGAIMNGQHITLIGSHVIVEAVQVETITLETCRANATQYARLVRSYQRSGHPLQTAIDYARLDITDPLFI